MARYDPGRWIMVKRLAWKAMVSHAYRVTACLALLIPLAGCASNSPLAKPALDGDIVKVRALLDEGADVNRKGSDGVPVLIKAALNGHTDVVRLLLEKGADINATNKIGVTSLMWAAQKDHIDTVRLLLDQGANVNQVSHGNLATALTLAAWKGVSVDTVRLLLDWGADVNYQEKWRETALIWAARKGHVDIVKLLLRWGANPQLKNEKNVTAAMAARNKENFGLARLLEQAEGGTLSVELPAPSAPMVTPTPSPPTTRVIPASDVDRLPSIKATRKKNAYAVVVGIEAYREQLPKADFAARDAALVGEYLTKVLGYPEENVVVRLNDRAARTDLVKYFGPWLRNNVEPGGSVFVYYSGHGAPNPRTGEPYLVPYDGDPTFLDSTGYPVKDLYASLAMLPARDIVVVLDSCFSGAGGRSVLAKGSRPLVITMDNPMLASGNIIVLAASAGDQIASTFDEKGHGLLTYFFLKGLHGEGDLDQDGAIDIVELYEFVKPNVQRVARKKYNNEQTPQLLAAPELLQKGGVRLLETVRQ